MNSFRKDLERGINIEKEVLSILKIKYPSASLVDKWKGYDIWIPEMHCGIEVKYDPMSTSTGNIVIEIQMYNKPSGLMASTAKYWVFYDDHEFRIMAKDDIINCIFLNQYQYKSFVGNGDTVSKKAFLVKKEHLFNYGKKIGVNNGR